MRLYARAPALAALCVLPLFALDASAIPEDLAFFTNFEDIFPNTAPGEVIVVGTAPETATLSGDAFAGRIGVPQLYHSGVRSWMVLPNGTGFIDFAPDAAQVEFWARTNPLASSATQVTAFDASGAPIGTPVSIDPGSGFQIVAFAGSIARIEIDNLDAAQLNGIDDFGFTPVPEPGVTPMLITALSVLALQRRIQSRAVLGSGRSGR